MNILVSICCITYNHEKFIADAIEGFLMQKTNFGIEIIIHDDASTDKTAEINRQYQKRYPDLIKAVCQTVNQYSLGVDIFESNIFPLIRGKYIAICEGDDYWIDPNKLQKQVDYLENNPGCTMTFHAAKVVNSENKFIELMKPYRENRLCTAGDICLGGGGFIPTASIVYRKELMNNPPRWYYKQSFKDFQLMLIVSKQGYAYYIDEIMSIYRTGVPGSWTDKLFNSPDSEIRLIAQARSHIDVLRNFNEYSNHKYDDEVSKAILDQEFKILDIEKKLKEMKELKYKDQYKTLNVRRKMKLHVFYYFPRIYNILKRFKKSVNKSVVK